VASARSGKVRSAEDFLIGACKNCEGMLTGVARTYRQKNICTHAEASVRWQNVDEGTYVLTLRVMMSTFVLTPF
jgi:hypothetical protein